MIAGYINRSTNGISNPFEFLVTNVFLYGHIFYMIKGKLQTFYI